MKTITIYSALNKKYIEVKVLKNYPEYGLVIHKGISTSNYILTDSKSGLFVKSFNKLKDAKAYVDANNKDFNDLYVAVEKARNTISYLKYCRNLIRRKINPYE